MRKFIGLFIFIALFSNNLELFAQNDSISTQEKVKSIVFVFDINKDIDPGMWRKTQKSFEEAKLAKADYIIINVNTY